MKDQNKPEWLLKAEQERDNFNNSKYGKMKDQHLNAANGSKNAKYDSEQASKNGKLGGKYGKIGGIKSYINQIAKYGEERYLEIMKERYEARDNFNFHSAGGKVSGKIYGKIAGKIAVETGQLEKAYLKSLKVRKIKQNELYNNTYNEIPIGWFTLKEVLPLVSCSHKQLRRIVDQYDTNRYQKDINFRPAKYKKI